MKKTKILNSAENLNHTGRWKYMIELGRNSINDEDLANSLLELALSKVHYERMLALMSAQGSFDKKIIATILEDSSVIGMGAVIKLAANHLDSDMLINIIPTLPKDKRVRIIIALFSLRRIDIIESVYDKLGVCEQQDILFYTSEKFFVEHLNGDAVESFTEKQWRQMARRFPSIALELIVEILEKNPEPSWLIQIAVYGVLRQFYKTSPNLGLSLLTQGIGCVNPTYLLLDKYSILFPDAVAKLVIKGPTNLTVSFPITVLRKLETEVLCELAEKNKFKNLPFVFQKLHHYQRAALYDSIGESLRSESGAMPLIYVKALPKDVREREAKHAFNLKIFEAKPFQRLPYVEVFSFNEALPLVAPFLSQPEGELRAAAISALVKCGRYYPAELHEILDFCIKRENEQDPVRQAMLTALQELPPTRWTSDHLPKIKLIIGATLRARDCSYMSMEAATKLLLKMLTIHTDFVIHELPPLVERMGVLNVSSFESHITNEDMVRLDSCLLPLLKTWIARDRYYVVSSLILSFGCRIKSVYNMKKQLGIIQLLIDMTQDKRGNVARVGLDTLIRLDLKEIVMELIPKLIKQDSSWVMVNSVSGYLHRYRQELLTPFLKPRKYSNRFSSGNTENILAFNDGFFRWTPSQQQIYSESISGILKSNKRNAWELYSSINRLSAMPSADINMLVNLARRDAKDIALRDKALEALGRLDAGRGVNALIEALNDDRARVAIYALRRSILAMPEKSAIELLSIAPRNKVTVVKEILRLSGEFHGEDSYNFLSQFAKDEDLHRDAQIALLRGFWNHLNREEVWEHFHSSAQSSHVALARSTIRIPQEGLTQSGRQHLCKQMTLLLQNENAQIRMETLERLVDMPLGTVSDEMFKALTNLLEDIDVKICSLAAEAMLTSYLSKNINALVDAFTNVKRPKSVAAIVEAFQNRKFVNIRELRNCAKSLSLDIINQKHFPSQALRLAITVLLPVDIMTIIESIDSAGQLHPGALEYNLKSWNKAVEAHTKEDIYNIEAKLRSSGNAGQRRLGLGLLIELSTKHGWTSEGIEYLGEYCRDTDLWVSEAAGIIEPPCQPELSV